MFFFIIKYLWFIKYSSYNFLFLTNAIGFLMKLYGCNVVWVIFGMICWFRKLKTLKLFEVNVVLGFRQIYLKEKVIKEVVKVNGCREQPLTFYNGKLMLLFDRGLGLL